MIFNLQNMKSLLITALALLGTFAHAQKLENSLLWKVSGKGLSQPSYIFGTIHITCDATLEPKVLKALDNTQQLYLELDMDDPNMQMAMMGGMMMKDGKTMSEMASEEDFKAVDAFLQENIGMPAKMLNTIKPAMISTMLIPKLMDCPMKSFEEELMKVTKEQKEEVYGLEKVEEQLAVFDAIPYERQMEELVKAAKEGLDAQKKEFADMMEIYASGNINEMHAYMKKSENQMYAEYEDVMLDNRNKNWIPIIEKTAKDKPTFFGVGAAHLAGENGVINLLRKQGYKVEAVQ